MRSFVPQGCDRPLAECFDALLLDLDGVAYLGPEPVPHAVAALAEVRRRGTRVVYVTNNASRTPEEVAAHLRELGHDAQPDDVVTAAQAAARLLADRLPEGAPVLVTGAEGLRRAVADAGLTVVARAEDRPAAVVQGYAAGLCYADLAEAALAIRSGALWVATNTDATLPTPRGPLPGNGALVAAVAAATGATPVVAGKPEPPLHEEAVRRTGARHPLVVGDRLETDIAGAVRSGTPALAVLTGVVDARGLLEAGAQERPTFVAADLRGLLSAHPEVRLLDTGVPGRPLAECGGWRAEVSADGAVELARVEVRVEAGAEETDIGDGLDGLRALLGAVWAARDEGGPGVPSQIRGDDAELERLGLR